MLTEIAVPYADTSAGALHWSTLPPDTPPLDEVVLAGGGVRLVLHLLGASHSASLHAPAGRVVETVACPAHGAAGDPLPAASARSRVCGTGSTATSSSSAPTGSRSWRAGCAGRRRAATTGSPASSPATATPDRPRRRGGSRRGEVADLAPLPGHRRGRADDDAGARVGGRRGVAVLAATSVLLAGCANGDDLYDYVAQNYEVLARNGDSNIEARSPESVDRVAGQLLDRFPGRDLYQDPTAGTFYRYDDEFVAVRPDPAGGALISVDDDDVGSTRWVPIIGGFYLPGGRFGGPRTRSGGSGETNRGGGPGSGK